MPGDAATLVANLCVCGPLIYLGLWMIIGPSNMVSVLNGIEVALRRCRDNLQWPHWQDPLRDVGSMPDSPGAHILVRLFGLAVAIAGLAHLAGMAE